jgi:hypothetical protein
MKTMLIAVCGLLLFACSKQDKQNQIENVFVNNDLRSIRSKPFNPIQNDYTTKIEKVGYGHVSLGTLKANSEFANISKKYNLNLSDIRRHYYDHSPAVITFIPIINQQEKQTLVIYNLKQKYYFAVGKENELTNGYRHISFSSVDNHIFYEFQLSKENRLGKLNTHSSPFEDANREMVSMKPPFEVVSEDVGPGDIPLDPAVKYGCCSKPFNDCMNCFSKSCSDDWKCQLMCGVTVVYCTAAWALSCSTGYGCNYPINDGQPGSKLEKDPTLTLEP